MSLYRKYRPDSFSKVIGQDHITTTITNQLKTGTLSHAYLFCGTRGTGKTSIARLLARAINCTATDIAAEKKPCNSCDQCREILKNSSPNVIEIDAASNNGVDNIRDILEEVKYPPVTGQHKIYIIDEVHMLSMGAFNALLKTLEEPPEHVIFMLATTDPHKVPATIHSRCQRYEFRRIPAVQLVENMNRILQAEGQTVEPEAVWLIASLGDGSARDSLSLLGQTLAFYGGQTISAEQVREMVGMVDRQVLFDMTWAVINRDSLGAIQLIHDMGQAGRDFSQFAGELLTHMRNLALTKLVQEPGMVLDVEPATFEQLVAQSRALSQTMLQAYMDQLSALVYQIKTEKNQKIRLEVTMIKLCHLGATGESVAPPMAMTMTMTMVVEDSLTPVPTKQAETKKMPAEAKPIIEAKPEAEPAKTAITESEPVVAVASAQQGAERGFDSQRFIEAQPILEKTLMAACKITKDCDIIYIQADETNLVLLKPKQAEIEARLKQMFGDNLSLVIRETDDEQKKIEPTVARAGVAAIDLPEEEPQEDLIKESLTELGLTEEERQDLKQKIKFNITFS